MWPVAQVFCISLSHLGLYLSPIEIKDYSHERITRNEQILVDWFANEMDNKLFFDVNIIQDCQHETRFIILSHHLNLNNMWSEIKADLYYDWLRDVQLIH